MLTVKYRAIAEINARGRRVPSFLNRGIAFPDGVSYAVEEDPENSDYYIVDLTAPQEVHEEVAAVEGVEVVP